MSMTIDRRTIYPPIDEPLLDGGLFEAGFIALHPFFEINGIDPALADYRTRVIRAADYPGELPSEIIEKIEAARYRSNLTPDIVDFLAKTRGRTLTWRDMCAATGIRTFSSLNRALLTSIGALNTEEEDREAAEGICSYCRAKRIFMPTEGRIQSTMEREIAALFRKAGVEQVELAGEFDEVGVSVDVSALMGDEPWNVTALSSTPTRIYAQDRSLLVVVDWDSFFTLICGTFDAFRKLKIDSSFEGFSCSGHTRHGWWRQDA